MTTLSLLPGPLKRFFAKIDAAATSDRSLKLALDHWRSKRGNRVLPKLSEMDMQQFGPSASEDFFFESYDEDDWALRFAGKDVESLARARARPMQSFPPSAIGALRSACGICSSSWRRRPRSSRRPMPRADQSGEILGRAAQHRWQQGRRSVWWNCRAPRGQQTLGRRSRFAGTSASRLRFGFFPLLGVCRFGRRRLGGL